MVLAMTQKLDNSVFGCKYSAPILVPDQARYHSRPHQPAPVPLTLPLTGRRPYKKKPTTTISHNRNALWGITANTEWENGNCLDFKIECDYIELIELSCVSDDDGDQQQFQQFQQYA
jgi:hypothetical protein